METTRKNYAHALDITVTSGGPFERDNNKEFNFDEQNRCILDFKKIEDLNLDSRAEVVSKFWKKIIEFRDLNSTALA